MKTVTSSEGTTTYFYDVAGNLVKTELPNGVVETRDYDELNRLKLVKNTKDGVVISSFDYTLDLVGHRRVMQEQNGRKVEYEYDSLYRLTKETITDAVAGNRVVEYSYDKVGNRLTKNDSVLGITTYTYDDNDRLLMEELKQNGVVVETIEYRYDDNGNLISQIKNGVEEVSYTWDKENRLIGVRKASGEVISYQYDSDGIRVSSTVNGVKTEYLVDKNLPYAQVLEERVNNGLTAAYVYGNDLISQQRGSEKSFYLVDGLGSTRGLTNQSGIVTDTYAYDAFGNLISSTNNVQNNYLFAGEQFDKNLGDYYLRARYYDTDTGRFTRRDSYEGSIFDQVSQHKYLYANANPVNLVDPSGKTPQTDGDIVHSKVGLHFIRQVGITETNNPMNNEMFTRERAYDPRTPFTNGNRPTFRRIVRTATGIPNHPGIRGLNTRLYPDLVDFTRHELYEIKPADRQAQIDSGRAELASAVSGLHSLGLTDWHQGTNYIPPSIIPLAWVRENLGMNVVYPDSIDNITHGKFAVVWNLEPGIIVYRINDPRLDLWAAALGVTTILSLTAWLTYQMIEASGRSQRTLGLA